MKTPLKAAIVIATLAGGAGFFIVTNYLISLKYTQGEVESSAPPTLPLVLPDTPATPSPKKQATKKAVTYPDSPKKKLCKEFALKAAPDILLKGPEGIDALNKETFRCRVLYPATMPLTKDQLAQAREETFTACMENQNKHQEKEVRKLLDELPSDCKE